MAWVLWFGLWPGFPIFQQKSSNYRNFVAHFPIFENKNLELSERLILEFRLFEEMVLIIGKLSDDFPIFDR